MKLTYRALVTALILCSATQAFAQSRPLVIHEAGRILKPAGDVYSQLGAEVATNGEYALVSAQRWDSNSADPGNLNVALLYHLVNGAWIFEREMLSSSEVRLDHTSRPLTFAMKGAIAVISTGDATHVYRLTGTTWSDAGGVADSSADSEIEGQRIVIGTFRSLHRYDGLVLDPDGNGGLTRSVLIGEVAPPLEDFAGGPVDLSADRVILGKPNRLELEQKKVLIYQRAGAGWQIYGSIADPELDGGAFGDDVALRGLDAIISGRSGHYVYRLPDLQTPVARLRSVDSYAFPRPVGAMEKSGDLVFVQEPSVDRGGAGVVNVFRADSAGDYSQVAVLEASTGASIRGSIDIAGTMVIAGASSSVGIPPDSVLIFKLPAFATPAPRYDTFESGNGVAWTASPGAQFSVAATGSNHVFRQSSLAGDAQAVLTGSNWTDQAIEADVRPTAFNGADRWAGLATRYANAQNYYYVTLRSSGSVQLRRIRNGVFTTLASAPLAVTANRSWRVRLESIGSTHRVFVDGRRMLEVDDQTLRSGNAALVMFRTSADYDNVIVSPAPRTTIYADDFNMPTRGDWSQAGGDNWSSTGGAYVQSSVGGDARAIIGTPTTDQSVSVRAVPTAYAPASGTAERWIGVVARYRDPGNFYYASLRSSNMLSLRKLVNGAIVQLVSVPVPVVLGRSYDLRLDAVGNSLRVYLNGVLTLQTTDNSHLAGSQGLVSFKAAATFDDYVAYQP